MKNRYIAVDMELVKTILAVIGALSLMAMAGAVLMVQPMIVMIPVTLAAIFIVFKVVW